MKRLRYAYMYGAGLETMAKIRNPKKEREKAVATWEEFYRKQTEEAAEVIAAQWKANKLKKESEKEMKQPVYIMTKEEVDQIETDLIKFESLEKELSYLKEAYSELKDRCAEKFPPINIVEICPNGTLPVKIRRTERKEGELYVYIQADRTVSALKEANKKLLIDKERLESQVVNLTDRLASSHEHYDKLCKENRELRSKYAELRQDAKQFQVITKVVGNSVDLHIKSIIKSSKGVYVLEV